jgi:hypothetical protein
VRRGGALRHSAQHNDLVSLIYIQACGGRRAGEPPGVSRCTEFAPNDQRIFAFFCIWSGCSVQFRALDITRIFCLRSSRDPRRRAAPEFRMTCLPPLMACTGPGRRAVLSA